MLEKEPDIQGIVNITPDHQHASINISALKKRQSGHRAQAGRPHVCRGAPHAGGGAREGGDHASARLQQLAGSPHAGGVDQRRRHRPRSRGAQLDESAVLAAGLAGVLHVRAGRAGRLQLGALAGSRAGSPVSPGLHVHALPWLVRLRRRLPRRHGLLQPVAAVPDPEARDSGVRRSAAQQRRVRRAQPASAQAGASRRSVSRKRARCAGGIRRRRTVRPSTRSGTTAA